MINNLEVIDECGRYNNNDAGCGNYDNQIPSRIWVSQLHNNTKYKTLAGGTMSAYDFDKVVILLKNGSTVYFGGSHNGPTIMIDVNTAAKGPNILGRDFFGMSCLPTQNCKVLKPLGAEGTKCADNDPSCSAWVGVGTTGCSKDIGAKNSNWIFEAAGAGCSAKYLLE